MKRLTGGRSGSGDASAPPPASLRLTFVHRIADVAPTPAPPDKVGRKAARREGQWHPATRFDSSAPAPSPSDRRPRSASKGASLKTRLSHKRTDREFRGFGEARRNQLPPASVRSSLLTS